MKHWSRKRTLISGIALILVTNAVALLGVGWNRSKEPESTLKLTQRELLQPYYLMNQENSGVSLRLNWRVSEGDKGLNYSYSGGAPDWLDQAKMASLGFDVSQPSEIMDSFQRTRRQLSKEVFLVLEMDGPTYQHVLQHARQNAAELDAKLAARPDDKTMKDNDKRAHDEVKHEEKENSRLFAVDAGLDRAELRAKYPDRSHYAIVQAQVRPWSVDWKGKPVGYIDKVSTDEINVPYEFHSMLGRKVSGQPSASQAFEASVAFGQRLEPWLLGVSASAN